MKAEKLTRRDWLKLGAAGAAGLSGATILDLASRGGARNALAAHGLTSGAIKHGAVLGHQQDMGVVGTTATQDDFDPGTFLTHFDYGEVQIRSDGRTVRHWDVVAVDRDIQIAPGVWFPAWTYNGQVPGPTFRCTEGDILRVEFTNAGSHPHTIHFHGTHPTEMDGVEPIVQPGEKFTYEFEAKPFGLHLYHCHTMPVNRHIHQ